MKVLITGASGFLGREFTKLINKKKYKCFFLSRRFKTKKYCYAPLQRYSNIKKVLEFVKPDIIVNLAAEINFKKKIKNLYNINARPLKIFSEYCAKEKKYLIHSSTVMIHGAQNTYSSRSSLLPQNGYGKSKLLGDRIIINSKCKYTILRFGGIYGKNGPKHLSINKFINDARRGNKIIFSGNPYSCRNYVFVGDAAKILMKCLEKNIYGIFYIGGEKQNFETMLKKINKILGRKKEIVYKKNNEPINNQLVLYDKIIKQLSFSKSLKLIK